MRIAITGGTGFLGRYIVRHLAQRDHTFRCWYRPKSDRGGFDDIGSAIDWLVGDLTNVPAMHELVSGVDAVVHSALDRPGAGFRGAEGDLATFVERNVLGTVRLIEAARSAGVPRFIFIGTCAVHEVILDDRKLDEAHPLWPTSHYGAHKAAIEKFIHSYGLGGGYEICSLRPTGIYGVARPVHKSKWYDIVHAVQRSEPIDSAQGGKEVHAADVAQAVEILLAANGIAGQAYNCYDMYVSHARVAEIAKRLTGSISPVSTNKKTPKHQIDTSKLRALGMTFGGEARLQKTVKEMLAS